MGSKNSSIRVRYAPSPTGYLHVGGVRTLLFNWLFARRHGGTLIIRVEDTDQARSTLESEEQVLATIQRLKLDYDEGPTIGGPHPPYRQSERLALYGMYAKQLLNEGKAYYCFCPEELIGQKREAALKMGKPPHYDGTCARIPKDQAAKRVAGGEKAGLRFRTPNRSFNLKDHVRGDIEFKEGTVGDFFITRSIGAGEKEIAAGIGFPVYNFCCVIDDHLMEMSHVIRGEDHLSNTARQLMIYDAFGWKTPEFAHTAMVLGADKTKLSKRNGDVSAYDYLEKGFLGEALLNFLVLLGWWPPKDFKPKSGHPEILSRDELIATFDLEGLQKAPGVFDTQKLRWMNSFYIQHMTLSELASIAAPFFEAVQIDFKRHSSEWFEKVLETVRGEVHILSELPAAAALFFEKTPALEEAAKVALADPIAKKVVESLLSSLQAAPENLTASDVDVIQKSVASQTGAKGKGLFMPIRSAITGRTHGPELKLILPLLGKATAVDRVKDILTRI
ncbi:MAG: glutamate--tRNA ligase [Bdellovibrionota bacterium]